MQDLCRKADILTYIQTEHTQLEKLLANLSEEQMLRTGVAGSWSVKDVLVHLSWWEQDLLQRLRSGDRLKPDIRGDQLEVDHANARIIEARRHTPLAEVLREFTRSYQELWQAIEGLAEETLNDETTRNYILDNTGAHYAEHRIWIESGLSPRRGFYAASRGGRDI